MPISVLELETDFLIGKTAEPPEEMQRQSLGQIDAVKRGCWFVDGHLNPSTKTLRSPVGLLKPAMLVQHAMDLVDDKGASLGSRIGVQIGMSGTRQF